MKKFETDGMYWTENGETARYLCEDRGAFVVEVGPDTARAAYMKVDKLFDEPLYSSPISDLSKLKKGDCVFLMDGQVSRFLHKENNGYVLETESGRREHPRKIIKTNHIR